MSRITKSITFDDIADADLLAWIYSRMSADTRPGERPDFSRFVRGILYRAFLDAPASVSDAAAATVPETLLTDIRAVVEAAVTGALHNANITSSPAIPTGDDDDDFSGLLLD